MSTTIRERILEEATLIVEGVAGIGTVHRWKSTARPTTYGHLDAIIKPGEETSDNAALGNPGPIRVTLPLTISVVLSPDETEAEDTDELISIWGGLLANAFLANRLFVESVGSVRLAIDSMPVVLEEPEDVDGASAAAIRVDISYEHDGDNVTKLGTAIPAD